MVAPAGGATTTARYGEGGSAGTASVAVDSADRNADYNPQFGILSSNFYDELGLCVGRDSGGSYQTALAFTVDIPPNAAILGASLDLTATNDQSGSPIAVIRGYAIADVPPFPLAVQQALIDLHPTTESAVDWIFPSFSSGSRYRSPDLAPILQEIVNTPGWQAGSYLGVVMDGSNSSAGQWRCVRNFTSGQPTRLDVTFALSASTAPDVCDPDPATPWRRCDFNCDGSPDISDVVGALGHLFTNGDGPCCAAGLDCNGDALGDITDWIFLLFHLFLGNVTPPAPFPDCGTSGEGQAGCDAYSVCS